MVGVLAGRGAHAQGTTWARNFGGAPDERPTSIVALSPNALVVTGRIALDDPLMIRVDGTGTIVWKRTIVTPGTSDAFFSSVAAGDHVVLAGSCNACGAGGLDGWVMRLDGSGNVVWQKSYGTAGDDGFSTILAAPGGGFYLIGNRGTTGWIVRIDDGGAVVWEKLYYTLSMSHAIAAAGGGLMVIGVRLDRNCEGGCIEVPNFTLLRLDEDGAPLWQYRNLAGARNGDMSPRIAQSSDGTWFVVSGQYNGASTVSYLTRISEDGSTVLWHESFFGLERGPRWIIGTSDGGLLLAGDTAPFDPWKAWLVKLDAAGTIVWQRRYGGTSNGLDRAEYAVEVPGGGFAFAGYGNDLRPPANGYDLFIGKVDALGHMPDSPCDLETDTMATPGAGQAGVMVVTPSAATTVSTVTTTGAVLVTAAIGSGQCVNFDTDGDAIVDENDNCPAVPNAGQQNADGDAFGDACDPCPFDAANDADADGHCANVDNCPFLSNPGQADADADGRGNLCDICPTVADPSRADSDGDGRGDACDCQPQDPADFRPVTPASLTVAKDGTGAAALVWSSSVGADAYSVTRGVLADIRGGTYGDCLAEGLTSPAMTDGTASAAGQAYFYLVQAQNFDCGSSDLGLRSNETIRVNGDPQACSGALVTDVRASGQSTVFGTVVGGMGGTLDSDDTVESIQEVLSTGGSPASRFSRLEHRWTFTIPAGSSGELHVEGWRTASTDGDDFAFEWATDGVTFHPIALGSLPTFDPDVDQAGALPAVPAGTLTIRVVDTNRTAGTQALDTVTLDEVFVRVIP